MIGTPDARLRFTTPQGDEDYVAHVKSRLNKSSLDAVVAQLQTYANSSPENILLITHHVPDNLGEELIRAGIEFADTAGNVYLNSRAGFIRISGKKPKTKGDAPTTAFTQSGLKVIYVLLTHRAAANLTYRDLGDHAGVALGTVSNVIKTLDEQGYIRQPARGRIAIISYHELLEKWEQGYLERLRPKLRKTYWATAPARFEQLRTEALDLKDQNIWLGGEVAAAKLTGMLFPESLTLHAPGASHKELAKRLKLFRTDERPQVIMIEPFIPDLSLTYSPAGHDHRRFVHPILIRAELLAIGGERLRETANELLQRFILPELAHAH
jgi:hypothetical protein